MPQLPDTPSLEHLKREAKQLLRAVRAGAEPAPAAAGGTRHEGAPSAGARPEHAAAAFRLADAQHAVARSYGFTSWRRLREHLETIERYARRPHERAPHEGTAVDRFLTLACLNYGADDPARPREARALLAAQPDLARASLHAAAAAGDAGAARSRLADVNRDGGPHAWPPLLYLAYSRVGGAGALETARVLLDAGADPDAGYLWEGLPSPFTALTGALGGGEGDQPAHPAGLALARLLLEAGADANDAQSIYNRSWTTGDDWLELLFAYGLGRGDGGPWHRRLAPRHPTPAELVEDCLAWSVYYGNAPRVRLILAQGLVDPDGRGTRHPILRGRRPLEQARLDGQTEMAEALRAAGAREAELDPSQQLEAAYLRGERPASHGVRARPGLVIRAVELRRPEALRRLAEDGYDLDHKARRTALHEAAFAGEAGLVRLLLDLGADPAVTDDDHAATPAGWAEHAGHAELAAELRAAEARRAG